MTNGEYTVIFIEPKTMKVLKEVEIVSDSELTVIDCPQYELDLTSNIIASNKYT